MANIHGYPGYKPDTTVLAILRQLLLDVFLPLLIIRLFKDPDSSVGVSIRQLVSWSDSLIRHTRLVLMLLIDIHNITTSRQSYRLHIRNTDSVNLQRIMECIYIDQPMEVWPMGAGRRFHLE
jgi:hypothetical protein